MNIKIKLDNIMMWRRQKNSHVLETTKST